MLTAPFTGFTPATLEWFRGIEANNGKAWFDANRDTFEAAVRDPLTRLLEELGQELGGSVRLFRQNRDIRLTHDKSPYKTSSYGVIHLPDSPAGLYAAISARGFHAGSGYYRMARDQLDRYRAALQGPDAAAFDDAVGAMEAGGLTLEGAALKSAPRGVAKDHPLIRYLRLKSVLAMGHLGPGPALDGKRPRDFAARVFELSRPVMAWMDAHVGPSQSPPEARFARGR